MHASSHFKHDVGLREFVSNERSLGRSQDFQREGWIREFGDKHTAELERNLGVGERS